MRKVSPPSSHCCYLLDVSGYARLAEDFNLVFIILCFINLMEYIGLWSEYIIVQYFKTVTIFIF